MLRTSYHSRPAPAWLIESRYQDRHLGALRSGKEAEVFLVEGSSAGRSCLLAHKRYRPRVPRPGELRELGFSKGTIYHNDRVYRQVGSWTLESAGRSKVAAASVADSRPSRGRPTNGPSWNVPGPPGRPSPSRSNAPTMAC